MELGSGVTQRALVAGVAALAVVAVALQSPGLQAQAGPNPANVSTAGELVVEPPTLINLGFEWFLEGDANRNASVEVAYRKAGESAWRAGLPMLRMGGERIYSESRVDVVVPNMFGGSVLDLEPDTAYEVRLTLADPDGVAGEGSRTMTVRTRPEP